ncbi:hypothetical protein RND81_12G010800 [Saponaria officinalis]|uniref:Uncharacterized protein n=1 Tax=Saponaria officinalis TaxID=3572 RepID=A0AAW1H5W5_SAPOF
MMESRVVYKGPPDDKGYRASNISDLTFPIAAAVGGGFEVGTEIGFFYHFIKGGNSSGFKYRLGNAVIKAPCIGGNLALFSLGHVLSRTAYFIYIGKTPHGDASPYEIHCAAIGGVVGFARYGLRAASLAALVGAGVVACDIYDEARKTRYGASLCKTNTYSYPHYRHPHPQDNDIPLQQALLYGSKLPED